MKYIEAIQRNLKFMILNGFGKEEKKMIILGIDQSYNNIGLSIANENRLIRCKSYNLKKYKTKTEKRLRIQKILRKHLEYFEIDFIIVERVRMYSQGFINYKAIASMGALVACIIDTVFPIKVYSVDTRSWKSKILGKANTSKKNKKVVKGEKIEALKFINKLGFKNIDDDAADSGCIALYGFLEDKIIKEEH